MPIKQFFGDGGYSVTVAEFNRTSTFSEKTELLAAAAYGDGRPWDAGVDRSMANALNNFHDHKSATSCPMLSVSARQGLDDGITLFTGIVGFGMQQPGATVSRSLFVAPWMRSVSGGTANITVTLSRLMPSPGAGVLETSASQFMTPDFGLHYSTATFTTTSTTWATATPQELNLEVKDPWFGLCWLTIEADDFAQTRGLAVCYEGPRVASGA